MAAHQDVTEGLRDLTSSASIHIHRKLAAGHDKNDARSGMRDGGCPAGPGRPSAGADRVPWAAARPNPLAGHLAHRRQPALHQARAGKPDGAGHDVGEEIGTPCSFPISRTREPRIPLSRRAEAGFSTRARSSGRRPTDLRRTRSGPADARSLRTSAGRVSARAFSVAFEGRLASRGTSLRRQPLSLSS